jgi:predicted phage tail protein
MQLVEVALLGELGRKFGRKYSFMASSPKDVFSALCNQLKGFKEYMEKAHENGIGFRLVDDDPEGMDYANLVMGCRKLIIAPIVSGGGTIGRILIGVALIALSFVSFGAGSAFAGFIAGTAANTATGAAAVAAHFAIGSGILFSMGTSLVLTGIASMLTPPVKNPQSDTAKKESYLFDRAAELTTQGSPVPILYGRFLVGNPLIVSSSITTFQVPV